MNSKAAAVPEEEREAAGFRFLRSSDGGAGSRFAAHGHCQEHADRVACENEENRVAARRPGRRGRGGGRDRKDRLIRRYHRGQLFRVSFRGK